MHEPSPVIEDLLRHPLKTAWSRVTGPVRYCALELGDVRYAWTVPAYRRGRTDAVLPQHYALTLRLSPFGDWRVEELKPFEWAEHAERWARGLWRDAFRALPLVGSRGRSDEVS